MNTLNAPARLHVIPSYVALLLSLLLLTPAQATELSATVDTCFTPGMDCEQYLVGLMDRTTAGQHVYIQAYSFTSAPLAKAVGQAAHRGVHVAILLDHSQRTEQYSSATFFAHAGLPVAIDAHEDKAHNKIIIFEEQQRVVTGSFNFTKSAQHRNAENMVILSGSPELVRRYLHNFQSHWQHSQRYAASQ